MPITVFQHDAHATPGRLGRILRDHAFKLDIREVWQGEGPPADFDEVDGVITLGGTAQADEAHHWIQRECDFLREAHQRGLPVLGLCLGAQLLAKALGGEVGPMDRPEVGFPEVTLAGPPAHTDTMLAGIAWSSPQFSLHSYEVKQLPEGATLLASSERCRVQAYRAGMRTYGFQYHFEADDPMIRRFVAGNDNLLHRAGLTTDEFRQHHEQHADMFARLADRLCENLATYLIPRVANEIRV